MGGGGRGVGGMGGRLPIADAGGMLPPSAPPDPALRNLASLPGVPYAPGMGGGAPLNLMDAPVQPAQPMEGQHMAQQMGQQMARQAAQTAAAQMAGVATGGGQNADALRAQLALAEQRAAVDSQCRSDK